MMFFAFLSLLIRLCRAGGRYVVYYDDDHQYVEGLPRDTAATFTHVIIAFVPPSSFTSTKLGEVDPSDTIRSIRNYAGNDTKVMVSIGGPSDMDGFSTVCANDTSRAIFSSNVAAMLNSTSADGVDIDWEYPGGKGADWQQTLTSAKAREITNFPLLLAAIRSAIGPKKLLSIVVPGLQRDMMAYNNVTSPAIWRSVDFVNVKTYDFMDQRDNVTKHVTDIWHSLNQIQRYIKIGLDPQKVNLGFGFHSKYFSVDPTVNCTLDYALGCKVLPLEDSNGIDLRLSGTMAFERESFFVAPDPATIPVSPNGRCGPAANRKCLVGDCCNEYGYCGKSPDYCGLSCFPAYGDCPRSSRVSFLKSQVPGASRWDPKEGGQYWFDADTQLFWSFETPYAIQRKFDTIVKPLKLGGVMAFSLGEDNHDFALVKAVQDAVANVSASPNKTTLGSVPVHQT